MWAGPASDFTTYSNRLRSSKSSSEFLLVFVFIEHEAIGSVASFLFLSLPNSITKTDDMDYSYVCGFSTTTGLSRLVSDV